MEQKEESQIAKTILSKKHKARGKALCYLTSNYTTEMQYSMFLVQKQTCRQMEQNTEPRNKAIRLQLSDLRQT